MWCFVVLVFGGIRASNIAGYFQLAEGQSHKLLCESSSLSPATKFKHRSSNWTRKSVSQTGEYGFESHSVYQMNMIKCNCCGKFVSLKTAHSVVVSEDTEFSKEVIEILCDFCYKKEQDYKIMLRSSSG